MKRAANRVSKPCCLQGQIERELERAALARNGFAFSLSLQPLRAIGGGYTVLQESQCTADRRTLEIVGLFLDRYTKG